MAISTLDGVIAGMKPLVTFRKVTGTMEAADVMHSLLYSVGNPGAGAAPSPGLAGAALTSYAGQLAWADPVSGNAYLAVFAGGRVGAGVEGELILYDRLWHNSGMSITQTTAQTINSVAWPARDDDGTTNGKGVLVGVEVSSDTNNPSVITNTTMSYTNELGTAGKTATISSFPAAARAGTFVPFELAAGDGGVRSVQTFSNGTSRVSGTQHLVAYRELARVNLSSVPGGDRLDAVSGGFPRLWNGTVPCLIWVPSATTSLVVRGTFGVAQG